MKKWLSQSIFETAIFIFLGELFLAPKNIQVQNTKGIVSAGSPYGNSQVTTLAVIGTVKQAAIIPIIKTCRESPLNTIDTASIVKMALYP